MTFRTMIYIIRAKTFRTRKNFPGSNATLLPGFLGLDKIANLTKGVIQSC